MQSPKQKAAFAGDLHHIMSLALRLAPVFARRASNFAALKTLAPNKKTGHVGRSCHPLRHSGGNLRVGFFV
ncbi:MAG: hypothetical protein ACRYGJ_07480, partial [Janthinobacterium lividum]